MDVIYYVAASLDGFISTLDGSVAWLDAFQASGEDHGYDAFLASVDTLVMGRVTYEQVRGFGPWPYEDKRCLVFTNAPPSDAPKNVSFTSGSPSQALARLATDGARRVWMVGGGQLAGAFHEAGILSEVRLFLMPVTLGTGIRLFAPHRGSTALHLSETTRYPSGVVELRYRLQAS